MSLGPLGRGLRAVSRLGSRINPHKPSHGGTVAPPTLSSAVIPSAGTSISLTFSASVSIGAGGNGGASISMSGGASTLTYASGSGSTVLVYSLSRTVESGETGTVSYTQPGNGIEATSGGADVATFSAQALTNNSTYTSGGWVLRTASNTGLVGAGISEGSLTDQGSITYSSANNGQTITGKRFTDTVRITGNNITIDGCLFEWGNADASIKLGSSGTGNTVKNSTFRNSSGYTYHQINITGGSLTVDLCDISDYQDGITADGGSLTCRRSYFHDTAAPDPGIHRDGIEIYGGSNHLIELCSIAHANFAPTGTDRETSAINIAPWSGSDNVSGVIIQDSYIDGGHMHFVIDSNQSGTHTVSNVRVLRNRLGGHTTVGVGGIYWSCNNIGTTRVETEAALNSNPTDRFWWPHNAGPDVNYWWYCRNNPFGYPDLTPDNEGDIAQA